MRTPGGAARSGSPAAGVPGADRAGSPRISVVIPTFNRRDLVTGAVRALQRQRFTGSFEVVVVVDGSSDGTADHLRTLEPGFPLRVMEQVNRGAAAARNLGAQAAAGEILLFLDDDMEADPSLLAAHERHHDDGDAMVVGHMPLHPDSPAGILTPGLAAWAEERLARLSAPGVTPSPEDLLTGQLSIRRDRFAAVGGFDTAFTDGGTFGNEDLDFGCRVQREGVRVVFDSRAVSWQRYVVTPASYLRQRRHLGAADVLFARKHPDRHSPNAGRSRRERWLWRHVARVPAIGSLAATALKRGSLAMVGGGTGGYLARRLFAEACALQYWRGVAEAGGFPAQSPPRVLAYHAIRELPADSPLAPYTVAPEIFVRQIDTLVAAGFGFLDGDALVAFLEGTAELPPRSVLLTFDDCYTDLAETVLPVLRQRGIPALAFAVTGEVGGVNSWDRRIGAPELPLLDADGLRQLAAGGIEIGAHSHSHRMLTRVSAAELDGEIGGCVAAIERLGLPGPRFFSYPHGEADARVAAAVRAAGLTAAFTVTPAPVRRGTDSMAIPRIPMYSFDVDDAFARAVAGTGLRARIDSRARSIFVDLCRAWPRATVEPAP
jgi:glycosyltransferase involved in cell wall biosynthesis/peptidoglycan/xylan/chitin deacetylase (PgdA/CDA1 family)